MMCDKSFNEDRRRRYGKRVGDIVKSEYAGLCFVIGYYADNNKLRLKDRIGREFDHVAESLEIIKKAEDR